MELFKDVVSIIGSMVLAIAGLLAFGFVIYVLNYGITIPALTR